MATNKTKKTFLAAELKDISQIYSGKRNCCRCGCGGVYTATSFMKEPRSKIDDQLVAGRLEEAKEIIRTTRRSVTYADTYVDVSTGNGKCLTFYFDDLKAETQE